MDSKPQASRARRAAPYLLALAWLALGAANVARGLPHAGTDWRYRAWASQHHCYSAVLSLGGDRYAAGARPIPYLEDRIEYPVLLGLARSRGCCSTTSSSSASSRSAQAHSRSCSSLQRSTIRTSRATGRNPIPGLSWKSR